MLPSCRLRLALLIALTITGWPAGAQSILLDHRTATYGNPWVTTGIQGASSGGVESRTLVTTNALPAEGDFKIIGPLNVHARWPGSTHKATKLLAEQAKSLGANAVVEARVWQDLAFPAGIAPHGSGIAVRIKDEELLRSLTNSASTWE
ncbi:MAG: hypothetical protein HGA71_15605 [Azonexaceae bacterium]|nr:hypothetical protein [Azonexaceae bacterium]